MSTISTVAGTTFSGLTRDSKRSKRGSGTLTTPIFGSMVQNGKLALCALAFDKQLNNVDFPAFVYPTSATVFADLILDFLFTALCTSIFLSLAFMVLILIPSNRRSVSSCFSPGPLSPIPTFCLSK